MVTVISRTEAATIRARLRLRFNTINNHYEVYTTEHGSGEFCWYAVTDHVANWYKEHFGLRVESYLQPSLRSGGLIEVSNRSTQGKKIAEDKDTPP